MILGHLRPLKGHYLQLSHMDDSLTSQDAWRAGFVASQLISGYKISLIVSHFSQFLPTALWNKGC